MASVYSSSSSIHKLDEDEKLLEEIEQNDELFLQCYSVGEKNGLLQSDKATSCSTRSSYAASSDGACSPFPASAYASSVESSDDEEKEKQPDTDEEDNGTPEHLTIIEENTKQVILVKNICHDIEEQKAEKNLFSRMYCGPTCSDYLCVFLFVNGIFLAFGSWSLSQITQPESWNYVEGPLPIFVSCLMMFVCGFFAFITKFFQKRRQYKKLIFFVLVLSIVCTVFCLSSLIYLITVIHSSLNQLNACVFNDVDHICSCYAPNKKLIKFAENMGCGAVKEKLKEVAYAVSVLFGIGCLISMATALSACFLLCRKRRERRLLRVPSRKRSTRTNQNTNIPLPEDVGEESTFSAQQQQQHEDVLLTQPLRVKIVNKNKMKDNKRKYENKENGAKISSVATQTPSFMMPIYDVIDPNEEGVVCDDDTFSELSLEMKKYALPPSYNEAIQVSKKWEK